MFLKEWQYSLCTRFASQLLPPELFAKDVNDIRKRSLEFGLHKIEFEAPQSVQTELGLMQVFVEKSETTINGVSHIVPQEHRYILGHIIDGDTVHLLEKISQIREPAQEEGYFVRVETIIFDPTRTSAIGLAMRTDLDGQVRSMGYRHYWGGDKFELIDIAREGEEYNISIDRHFDRARRPPYSVNKTRRLQIHVSPEQNILTVEVDNKNMFTGATSRDELMQTLFETEFRSDDANSFFYSEPSKPANKVKIKNGIVDIGGNSAYWQTRLLGSTFINETTYQQLLPNNGVEIIAQEIQKGIRQFIANQGHINLEANQVVLI